jgi:hypothetical protein
VSGVASVSNEPTASILHPEDEGSTFIRNFDNIALIYTVPSHRTMINIMLQTAYANDIKLLAVSINTNQNNTLSIYKPPREIQKG